MNEAERTDVSILCSAALDFVAKVEKGEYVDEDDSESLRHAVKCVLPHLYG